MTTKKTARAAGEAAALDAPPLLYDHMPLANSSEADTLLLTSGVLPTSPSDHHVSHVLRLNPDAQMEQLCVAIALRARAVRGTLAMLENSEVIDEAHRAAAGGAGLLIDELCGLTGAVALALETFDRARGAM